MSLFILQKPGDDYKPGQFLLRKQQVCSVNDTAGGAEGLIK